MRRILCMFGLHWIVWMDAHRGKVRVLHESYETGELYDQQRLTRRPITGSFLRKQVQAIHDEAVGEATKQEPQYRQELNLR